MISLLVGVGSSQSTRSTIRRSLKRVWLIAIGNLVDVGGYRLEISCRGQGEITVVLDNGLCQDMSSWGTVPSGVAKFTRICTYNRTGRGYSSRAPSPRSGQQLVFELHTLLELKGISDPIVLVGHSFGGLNVRLFASQHPNEIAGIVLVDSSHEDQYDRFAALMSPKDREDYLSNEGGNNCEEIDLLSFAEEVRASRSLPNTPLVVLTADGPEARKDPERRKVSKELQADLARLLPNSKHIMAEKSGHFIQLHQPDLVIEAIRMVVDQAP